MARVGQAIHALGPVAAESSVRGRMSLGRRDGQDEAVRAGESRRTGSEMGRIIAVGRALAMCGRRGRAAWILGTRGHDVEAGRLAGPLAELGEPGDRGVAGQDHAIEPQGTTAVTAALLVARSLPRGPLPRTRWPSRYGL